MPTPNEGLPPDVQQRLDRLEELERQDAERRGEYQKLTENQKSKHASELARRDEQLSRLKAALIRTESERAISSEKGDIEALAPHVLPHLDVRENGKGGIEVFVKDPESNRPRQSLRRGGEMTLSEFVADLKEHKSLGVLFEGNESRRAFQTPGDRVVALSREQAKDPKVYQAMKEKVRRGEVREVRDHRGFLLLNDASV